MSEVWLYNTDFHLLTGKVRRVGYNHNGSSWFWNCTDHNKPIPKDFVKTLQGVIDEARIANEHKRYSDIKRPS